MLNRSPRVIGIIQARMGSARLPGKTLAPIVGKPLLVHVIERAKASPELTDLVVATTVQPEDLAIAEVAAGLGVSVYRGSAEDVLDRFHEAARQSRADVVVRLTADDPFKDPEVISLVVRALMNDHTLDYVSNTLDPTFPEGLDVEALTTDALEQAQRHARLPSEREHVTPFIWQHPERFRVANIRHDPDLSHLRWTIDYEEDLDFAREVYARLYRGNVFVMRDVLQLLEAEPGLSRTNATIPRNVGYYRSVQQDRPSTLH